MKILGRRTVLFTDVEGSTALLQRVGHPQFVELMDQHHQIIRAAIDNNNGEEVRTEGDAFVVFFPDPLDGLNCAIECQLAFKAGPWPPGATIAVRMGLHEGEIGYSESGHHGIALHEAARVSEAAHGGQVLLSDVAESSLRQVLPVDGPVGLRRLGSFTLKDIGGQVPLTQVTHPQLDDDFPLPRDSGSTPNNLPAQLTSLVGRSQEIAELCDQMPKHRLLTLLGTGGIGKTRLALRAAADMASSFPDGVWLIELAPLDDGEKILDEIRRTLRIPDDGRGIDGIADALRSAKTLMIFDNCEHLLAHVAGVLTPILKNCPDVSIMTTSREPVSAVGEFHWRVPALNLDDAVDLLIERALLVVPNLTVGPADRATLERVCQRLDGIPLAIELVAGRMGAISVDDIEHRLLNESRVLRAAAKGQLARHQTLEATLNWSYELLSSNEQQLFKRLAVFTDAFEISAAEAICADDQLDEVEILELIESLHMKSLINVDWSQRPSVVNQSEIVAQYADALLGDGPERDSLDQRHAQHYFRFTEDALHGFRTNERADWLARIDNGRENLIKAFDWFAEHDPSCAAVMAVNLKEWLVGSASRAWIQRIAALASRDDVAVDAFVISNALRSMFAGVWDFEPAEVAAASAERARERLHELTDPAHRANVLTNLAAGLREADPEQASILTDEAVAAAEQLGDDVELLAAVIELLIVHDEHHSMSGRLRTMALTLIERIGTWPSVLPLVDSALALHQRGDHEEALQLLLRSEHLLPPRSLTAKTVSEDIQVWTVWGILIRAETDDATTAILLARDGLATFSDERTIARKSLMAVYGQALLINGEIDAAREAFTWAIDPEDRWRYICYALSTLGLARIDLLEGKIDEAIAKAEPLARDNRRTWVRARAHDLLAHAYLSRLDLASAEHHAHEADSLRAMHGFAVPPALRRDVSEVRSAVWNAQDTAG